MSDLFEFLRTHEEAFRSRNRLTSLYSDFRLQKQSNPDGYQANSSAWLRGLTAAARAGLLPLKQKTSAASSHLAFTSGDELAQALQTPQYGRPPALDAVIRDAVEKRELIPLNDFLNAQKSIYSKSWVPSPWQVVSWGLKQFGVGGLLGGDKLAVGNFVVLANVEEAANAIIKQATSTSTSLTTSIYSRELFESTFANILSESQDMALSPTDMNILLAHLSRDKPILSTDGQTIKFKQPGETAPSPITEQDTNIASLRTLITSMTSQVDVLASRVSRLNIAVREAVAQKHMVQAKTSLRSKKLAESTLEARTATLAQLEDVYTQIENAADQVAVVRVMEASGSVLRGLHKEVGGVEGVEGVMERLREEMDKVDEVGAIINEANAGAVDEGEVDDELAEMERVEREKKEKEEKDEREKKEKEEAEATRLRLEELEKLEAERKKVEEEKAAKEAEESVKQAEKDSEEGALQNVSETA